MKLKWPSRAWRIATAVMASPEPTLLLHCGKEFLSVATIRGLLCKHVRRVMLLQKYILLQFFSVMYSVYVFWGLIKSGFSMFMHVCRLFNPRVGGGLIISILPGWKFTKYFSYTVQMNARIRWIAIIRYSKHLWRVRFSRLCNKEIVERHNTWLDQLGRFPGLQ